MLNCKQVATQASDYLDNHVEGKLRWNMRIHLLMCRHCRRFLRHLRITRDVASLVTRRSNDDNDNTNVDTEAVLKKLQAQQTPHQ